MPNIRIKDIPTTASATSSTDFIGIDGSANGTRKLNAYSPTFGGNLTATGTIRFDGQLFCGNAGGIQIRNATGDGNVVDVSGGRNLTMSGAATFGGNLTVSGGTITGGTSGLSLAAGGSVQNITITPSGGAKTVIRGSDGGSGTKLVEFAVEGGSVVASINGVGHLTVPVLLGGGSGISLRSNAVAQPILFEQTSSVEVGRFAATTGNFLIGTTTDGGQKLQVSGTIAASLGVSSNGSLAAFPAANSAAMDWNGGYARFWGVGADASTAGGLKLVVSSTDGSPFVEALTIASSGDATFAGDVTVSGGNMGVGIAASASIALAVTPSTLTGNTQYGVAGYPVFSSAATAAGYSGYFEMKTAASAFTMAVGRSIFVEVPTIGAGSAITTQSGIYVSNQGAGSITNAYGIDIAAQSGATTTNIGLRNLGATVLATPAAAVTLATNSTMTFELTSNTSLTIKVRGTDGTTRSVALTLA